MEIFWAGHNPRAKSFSVQYKCAVFFHDDEQRKAAEKSRDALAKELDARVVTEILPATHFYLAEDYHQKHELRCVNALEEELTTTYPRLADFVNSTAAARLNGYLGGHGTLKQLEVEIDDLGLSPSGRQRLLERARRYLSHDEQ